MKDDHGVSPVVQSSALGALLDDDTPAQPVTRHYVRSTRAGRAACGDTTGIHTDGRYATTCPTCLAVLKRLDELAETRRVLRKVGARLRRSA